MMMTGKILRDAAKQVHAASGAAPDVMLMGPEAWTKFRDSRVAKELMVIRPAPKRPNCVPTNAEFQGSFDGMDIWVTPQ